MGGSDRAYVKCMAATVVAFLARRSTADFPSFQPRYKLSIMARRSVTNRWFVSFQAPRERRLVSSMTFARQTETFPTEAAAKQFAKDMLLSDRKNIIAGTLLSDHDPARHIISGSDLRRWAEDS